MWYAQKSTASKVQPQISLTQICDIMNWVKMFDIF